MNVQCESNTFCSTHFLPSCISIRCSIADKHLWLKRSKKSNPVSDLTYPYTLPRSLHFTSVRFFERWHVFDNSLWYGMSTDKYKCIHWIARIIIMFDIFDCFYFQNWIIIKITEKIHYFNYPLIICKTFGVQENITFLAHEFGWFTTAFFFASTTFVTMLW